VVWITFTDSTQRVEEFREGLRDLGYVGAKALRLDVRQVERDPKRLADLIEDLIGQRVSLVVAHINAAPMVHRAVAGRLPVVFAFSGDPIEAGMVQSLARPGGTTTGMSFMALELVGKRLELIREIAPKMTRVAILANPQHPGVRAERSASQRAADQLGLKTAYVELNPARSFEAALDEVRHQACEGLIVFPDAGMLARASQIAEFALKERLLCVSGWPEFARSGCIASYGPNLREGHVRLAHYVDRILKGAMPANLPVELPTRFELVVNVKTAKALGLVVPASLLLRADEVIE
jgi:putative ABC transport system substrate-binding protein